MMPLQFSLTQSDDYVSIRMAQEDGVGVVQDLMQDELSVLWNTRIALGPRTKGQDGVLVGCWKIPQFASVAILILRRTGIWFLANVSCSHLRRTLVTRDE